MLRCSVTVCLPDIRPRCQRYTRRPCNRTARCNTLPWEQPGVPTTWVRHVHWLKIQGVRAYNFVASHETFPRDVPRTRDAGMFKWALFWGKACPPKIWEGKKRLKFSAISDNFRVWSRISPEQIQISKIGKKFDQLQPFPCWAKKRLWTLVHTQKSYRPACWPTQVEFRRQLSTLIHQVVLLRGEFEPPKIVSADGLAAPGGLTLGSAPYF